ncbi:MAG: nicotinate-nucleotide adenylyltransferase [Desulfopila sp.]|jgi:nicotinate-nucleotide adenylyltransferase|nr:nicotinate-nucleotide adenylyltransferase [Desulfopila sp.]
MRSIGLFGGTFDPIHSGHLHLAQRAMEVCHLDEVVFVPSASPPHKPQEKITSFHHRVAMLKLALQNTSQYRISEIEASISPPTYTIDMFSNLLATAQADTEYFFILGLDAFLDIPSWKEYKKVIRTVHFIVSSRPGFKKSQFLRCIEFLQYQKSREHWVNRGSGRKVFYLDDHGMDVSSSKIREMISNQEAVQKHIPSAVLKYIQENNLYVSEISCI